MKKFLCIAFAAILAVVAVGFSSCENDSSQYQYRVVPSGESDEQNTTIYITMGLAHIVEDVLKTQTDVQGDASSFRFKGSQKACDVKAKAVFILIMEAIRKVAPADVKGVEMQLQGLNNDTNKFDRIVDKQNI